jgi:histidine triad (HIT) family protein
MSLDSECVFCKIVAGELPAFKLYEDPLTLSFMDINPLNGGHALAITKGHYKNLFETPDTDLAAVMATARKVATAVERELTPAGINIVQANGPAAGQSVFHFHVHVLPRRIDDNAKINWGLKPGDMDKIEALAEKIRAGIRD